MTNEIHFILYQLPDEEGKVQVTIKDETIWATQKAIAQLLGVGVPAISKHPTRISEGGGLDKVVVVPNSQNIFVSSRLIYNNVWTNKET